MYALICVYCVFVLCECVTVTLSNYQHSKQCFILVPDLALH